MDVDWRARLHKTSGGDKDTELKELAVRPMSRPSGSRAVTMVTPVVNWPSAARNSSSVNGSAKRSGSGNLPVMGDGSDMTASAERRLGDRIARSIYRDPQYLDDPQLTDYLQALWQPLLGAARDRGDVAPELAERMAWELMISRDKRVNAFALPGGYMGVNLGLLAMTDRPEELASVMAHELSHVSQRHIARLIARQDQQSPWLVGTMILGVVAASASGNKASSRYRCRPSSALAP